MKPQSGLISRWANYGYDRDSWQESLLDFIGFVSDPSDVNTPLPEAGMACVVGQNPQGILSRYEYGDVLFHSTDPDEYFIRKPDEVRVLLDRNTREIWLWNFTHEVWYVAGLIDNSELVEKRILLTSQVLDARRIELAQPVLDMPPLVHLMGCGTLTIDVNFWMPDNSTITFEPTAGPYSLINFNLTAGVDILRVRYHSPSVLKIGG